MVLANSPGGPGPRSHRDQGACRFLCDHVDRGITSDPQQPCTETAAVISIEPAGNRAGNRHEYFLDQVFSVCRLKATAGGDIENYRTINRRKLVPCSQIFGVLKPQNQAGTGWLVSWFHRYVGQCPRFASDSKTESRVEILRETRTFLQIFTGSA